MTYEIWEVKLALLLHFSLLVCWWNLKITACDETFLSNLKPLEIEKIINYESEEVKALQQITMCGEEKVLIIEVGSNLCKYSFFQKLYLQ